MIGKKCGHCRRKARKVFAITAADGSKLLACACGSKWVRAAPDPPLITKEG